MAACLPCYVFCAMLNMTIIVRGGPKALKPACNNSTELQLKTNSTQFAWRQVNSTQLGNSTQPLNSPKLTSTLFTLRLLLLVCFSAAVLSQKTAFKALGKCRGRWLFVYTVNYRRCALCTVRLQLINLDRGRATCCMCAVNWVLHQQR